MPTSIDGYKPVGPFARNRLAPSCRCPRVDRPDDLFIERSGAPNICRAYLISDSCGRLGRLAVRAGEIPAAGPGCFGRADIMGNADDHLVGYPDGRFLLVGSRCGITAACSRPPASRAAAETAVRYTDFPAAVDLLRQRSIHGSLKLEGPFSEGELTHQISRRPPASARTSSRPSCPV